MRRGMNADRVLQIPEEDEEEKEGDREPNKQTRDREERTRELFERNLRH